MKFFSVILALISLFLAAGWIFKKPFEHTKEVLNQGRIKSTVSEKTLPLLAKALQADNQKMKPLPPLELFYHVDKKALRTAEQENEMKKILSGEDLRAQSFQVLEKVKLGKAGLEERFKAIHYYERAMGWKENGNRNKIIEDIVTLLRRNVKELVISQDERRVLLGDQVELFCLLSKQAPEEARSVNNGSALFEFAERRCGSSTRSEKS